MPAFLFTTPTLLMSLTVASPPLRVRPSHAQTLVVCAAVSPTGGLDYVTFGSAPGSSLGQYLEICSHFVRARVLISLLDGYLNT